MKLRCKDGDLAWVTYDEDACSANIGRLVRVSGPVILSHQYDGMPTWLIFPVDRRAWSISDSMEGAYPLIIGSEHTIEHPDGWLWPLRGSAFQKEVGADIEHYAKNLLA